MKIKYFSFDEFKDWVLAQPDERPINMDDNVETFWMPKPCMGCIMLQFAREMKLKKVYKCSMDKFIDEFGGVIGEIVDVRTFINRAIMYGNEGDGVKNYKEAKWLIQRNA